MEEQSITFETAKLAKEKGFNIPKLGYWSILYGEEVWSRKQCDNCWQLPTQSLLQKWLREKHNIDLFVGKDSKYEKYKCEGMKGNVATYFHNTYEEALEKGLQESLKLIE